MCSRIGPFTRCGDHTSSRLRNCKSAVAPGQPAVTNTYEHILVYFGLFE